MEIQLSQDSCQISLEGIGFQIRLGRGVRVSKVVMIAKLIYVLSSFHMLFCEFYIYIHVKLIKFPLNLVL